MHVQCFAGKFTLIHTLCTWSYFNIHTHSCGITRRCQMIATLISRDTPNVKPRPYQWMAPMIWFLDWRAPHDGPQLLP